MIKEKSTRRVFCTSAVKLQAHTNLGIDSGMGPMAGGGMAVVIGSWFGFTVKWGGVSVWATIKSILTYSKGKGSHLDVMDGSLFRDTGLARC
jgi:hypothetical protein